MQLIVHYQCDNLKNGNISTHVNCIMKEVAEKLSIHEEETLYYNIRLAIWEIFCNIVVHSHTNLDKKVQVKIEMDTENKIYVTIKDYGEGFQWKEKIKKEMPPFLQIGGRGLLFIQQVCEQFYFDSIGRKATIVFQYK